MKRLSAIICAGLTVAGCAGRDAAPVSAYMPGDAELSCQQINHEIRGNNGAIRVRVQEGHDTSDRNILIGTAAFLLFAPAAFAMDLKDAAGTEAAALEQRNRNLNLMANKKRCQTDRALTVAEAEAEWSAKTAEARAAENSDTPGVRTPTDQRLHQARAASPMPATAQASAGPVDRSCRRLRDLMDRFLRGEISKAEYDRLRAG